MLCWHNQGAKELYLSFAAQRNIFGSYNRNAPSRFLNEITQDLISIRPIPGRNVEHILQQRRRQYRQRHMGHGWNRSGSGAMEVPTDSFKIIRSNRDNKVITGLSEFLL